MEKTWLRSCLFVSGLSALCLASCSPPEQDEQIKAIKSDYYQNPVIHYSLPDPSVIRADDGYFYLYATEDIRNLPVHRSADLLEWEYLGAAFTEHSRPDFEPQRELWAPDINKIGNTYVLYYSMWRDSWLSGIGCATADKPAGPFKDRGKIFRSNEINVKNSIDPFFFEEADGRKYLFWGSFWNIYAIELSADGLSLAAGALPVEVAGRAYEGTSVHRREGYYYLFASTGTCCEGLNSTYQTVVGRSENLFGPYADKNGRRMLDNRHEVLIHGNSSFVGAGHNSEIVTDRAGNDWIFYHAVNVRRPQGRMLMMDKIEWTDGWPSVSDGSPSLKSVRPVF